MELVKIQPRGEKQTLDTHIYPSLGGWVDKNREVLVDMENTSWIMKGAGIIGSIVHQTFPEGVVTTIYPYRCVYDEKLDKGSLVLLSEGEVECELFK